MSLFDVLKNVDFGSALTQIMDQAKGVAGSMAETAGRQPLGGVGGLIGAGALGTLLGNMMSSDAAKGVALAGLGAVAWNFYQKWSQQQKEGGQTQFGQPGQMGQMGQAAQPQMRTVNGPDPTVELVARSMIYASRADGNIDEIEQQRIMTVLNNLMPGQNLNSMITEIVKEPVDPAKIAAGVSSPEQAEDVYRISCAAIDIDQFMEKAYLSSLAQSLGISNSRKQAIEHEADDARKQLSAAMHQRSLAS